MGKFNIKEEVTKYMGVTRSLGGVIVDTKDIGSDPRTDIIIRAQKSGQWEAFDTKLKEEIGMDQMKGRLGGLRKVYGVEKPKNAPSAIKP